MWGDQTEDIGRKKGRVRESKDTEKQDEHAMLIKILPCGRV